VDRVPRVRSVDRDLKGIRERSELKAHPGYRVVQGLRAHKGRMEHKGLRAPSVLREHLVYRVLRVHKVHKVEPVLKVFQALLDNPEPMVRPGRQVTLAHLARLDLVAVWDLVVR
jgi:hypothetical protein